MGKRVAVILSGCGFMDGAEVHESVLTLLALDRAGADVTCASVDRPQAKVTDHHAGRDAAETRNVRVESARIARGAVRDVRELRAENFDAVVLPGGFGAALNLCDFGARGADCSVDEGVAAFLRAMHERGRPIGAICIAPALVARIFGADLHPQLTIGTDAGTAAALEEMGAKHVKTPVDDIAVDARHKIVTTPAYMLARSIKEAAAGIEKLVARVIELA